MPETTTRYEALLSIIKHAPFIENISIEQQKMMMNLKIIKDNKLN
jgi:hypothetical protein